MRIGIAGISHESNSFSSQPTTLDRFREHGLLRGDEIVARHKDAHSTIAGVHPERFQIVIAKGVVAPRGAYQPIAAQIVLVDTPGATAADPFRFEYQHRRRPLYPFEPDAVYEP